MVLVPQQPQRDALTLRDFAEATDTPLPTLYDLIATHRFPLPLLKIGRTYRISRRAYEQWLAQDDTPTRDAP